MNLEKDRLTEDRLGKQPWRKWGPYVSERQWGTVREDYSANGDAWNYITHDAARSRAYRWGEDGLAGFCDDQQHLCLGLALWNGRDPILKERLFGLNNSEGNHGEDVKELYYYLDATPTHSYLKMLYKYPQGEFPYERLIEENARRGKLEMEFELIETGLFDENRYFDVFVEYAKAGPEDILVRITVHNRGPEASRLHLLPQIWFRNTWAWQANAPRPRLVAVGNDPIAVTHPELGKYWFHVQDQPELLFCDNDTNVPRLFGDSSARGFFKDAFHDYFIHGEHGAVNPDRSGTKATAHYDLTVPAGECVCVRLRLTNAVLPDPMATFDAVVEQRRGDADAYYAELQKDLSDPDARSVQRQAWAGMIWSKQYYGYDVREWLAGDPNEPAPPPERRQGRNHDWQHLSNADVISMPDKWEYPWYAGWDLAFHCITFALIDAEFAKHQLVKLTHARYMHPTGQLPAYEWNFSDVNPPVHAWAAWRVFQVDRKRNNPAGDFSFLQQVFHKLLLNFTWWVNRKDAHDRNVFQGGFLGLDNIGVFDRDKPLPGGGYLDQADGTSWMAMYCLNMLRIALELSLHDPVYQDMATKFFEHFLQIAESMTGMGAGATGLWDDEDEFYYDAVNLPDDRRIRLRVRSMVGLIPLFAVETLEAKHLEALPDFRRRLKFYLEHRPDLCGLVSRWEVPGVGQRGLLSLLRGHRMKRLLARMLDETEFLSDFGVRAVSRYHKDHPYVFDQDGQRSTVDYEPGESTSGMFGGNSNWRGPIWMPVNYLIIESLQKFHYYYGDEFKVECPTGSGKFLTIAEVSEELTRRLTKLFLRDTSGRRAVFGSYEKFQNDPYFRDYIPFHEYFHGDTGRGVGASHQTGWTGLIAKLLQPRRKSV
jgi:Glycosyl hydrolase family 63 C-terminal domain